MSIFFIDPLKPIINKPINGYSIHSKTAPISNTINNDITTLIYNNKIFYENKLKYLKTYNFLPDSVSPALDLNTVSDQTIPAYYPYYTNSKLITITNSNSALRNNKYNFYTGSYSPGYPSNNTYPLCEKLSLVYNNKGFNFQSRTTTKDSGYPFINSTQSVSLQNIQSCANPCNKICPTGMILDTASCKCVSPPVCIPQSISCSPAPIPQQVKSVIYGYIFYVNRPRYVHVPEIGDLATTCGGGHYCCRTIFTPKFTIGNSNIQILANRTVNLNNIANCIQNNIVPDGWNPTSSWDRADTFQIVVPDGFDLQDTMVSLQCELQEGCHEGVSMVYLVAHDFITNEPTLIFGSCIVPGDIHAKPIGTIDCNTNLDDTILCSPPPPPPPPSPSIPPECSIEPESCTSGYLNEVNCECYPSEPPHDPPPPCSPEPICTTLIEGYAFYAGEQTNVCIPGIGERTVRCWGGHCCDRTSFLPQLYFPNNDLTIYSDNYVNLNNASNCGDRANYFQFRLPDCAALCTDIPLFSFTAHNNPNPHNGIVFVILVITDPDTQLKRIIYEGCVNTTTSVEVSGRTCWPLPSCNIALSDIDNTQVLHDPPISSPSIDVEAPCCPSGMPVFYFNGEFTSGGQGDSTDWSNVYNWYVAEFPATLTVDDAKNGGGTRLSSLSPSNPLRSSNFNYGNFCAIVLTDVENCSNPTAKCATLTVINSKLNIDMNVDKGLANFYCSIYGDSDHQNISLKMSRADTGWNNVNHSPAPDCLYMPCTGTNLIVDDMVGEAAVNFYNNSNYSGNIISDPLYPPANLNINFCNGNCLPYPSGEPTPQASIDPETLFDCPTPSASPLCADFNLLTEGLVFSSSSGNNVVVSGTGQASDPVIIDMSGNNTPSYIGDVTYNIQSSGTVYIDYSTSSAIGDIASIILNFATQGTLDGVSSATLPPLSVSPGDILQVQYAKDDSGNGGTDSAHFEIVFCS